MAVSKLSLARAEFDEWRAANPDADQREVDRACERIDHEHGIVYDRRPSLIVRAADVQSRAVRWAWTGRLPVGYLVVQTGIEGLGKSVFAAWMIGSLTRGELDGEWRGEPSDVLVLAGEDGIADTWRPRLDLAGADLDRVSFLNFDALGPEWNLRDGVESLAAAVEESQARVIIIDAALDHMPAPRAGESINSPTFVRQAFAPLRQLTRASDLVTVFSMHPPKGASANYRDLVQASQAFSAIPRIGLLFAYHPEDEPDDPDRRRVFVRGKGNLGRDPGALEFRVVGRAYRHDDGTVSEREVVVGVRASSITMDDLAPKVGAREPTKSEVAANVIRDVLDEGEWKLATTVKGALADAGITSDSVIDRACKAVGVTKRRTAGEVNGPWRWRLRGQDSEGALDSSASRARSHTEVGAFDFSPSNSSNHRKTPTIQGPVLSGSASAKAPPSEDYARGREVEP